MKQYPDNRFWLQVGQYTTLAMLLPACILVGYGIGSFLDRAFHTGFLKVIFLLLGIAAGLIQLIRQLQKDTRDDRQ